MAQELDEKIVSACNELVRLKAAAAKESVENVNIRDTFQRNLEELKGQLETKLQSYRKNKRMDLTGMTIYKQACNQVFKEAGIPVTAFTRGQQAQLCQYIHLMMVGEHQHFQLQKNCEAIRAWLEHTIHRLQEEQTEIEIQMLNQIVNLEQDIQDLKQKCESSKDCKRNMPSRSVSCDSTLTASTWSETDGEMSDKSDENSPKTTEQSNEDVAKQVASGEESQQLAVASTSSETEEDKRDEKRPNAIEDSNEHVAKQVSTGIETQPLAAASTSSKTSGDERDENSPNTTEDSNEDVAKQVSTGLEMQLLRF